MKNFVLKSLIATCVTGIAVLLTPKTSVAQVNMGLLSEVVGSCQKDVYSLEYYNEKLGLTHITYVTKNWEQGEQYCISSRYFHSLVLSKLPWLASAGEMLPGYPGSVAVSQIAITMIPRLYRIPYTQINYPNKFLDCLITQNSYSEECTNTGYGWYAGGNPDDSVKRDSAHSMIAWMCPSCYVAYNNYPSAKRMVGSFIEWFMKLEPSHRKELMSILGDEQTQRNNRVNMRKEARRAWEEYKVIRKRIAEEDKEQRRRELFE